MTTFPIGSEHIFQRGEVRHQFKRMPGGWNDGRRLLDDDEMAAEGWHYVAPVPD